MGKTIYCCSLSEVLVDNSSTSGSKIFSTMVWSRYIYFVLYKFRHTAVHLSWFYILWSYSYALCPQIINMCQKMDLKSMKSTLYGDVRNVIQKLVSKICLEKFLVFSYKRFHHLPGKTICATSVSCLVTLLEIVQMWLFATIVDFPGISNLPSGIVFHVPWQFWSSVYSLLLHNILMCNPLLMGSYNICLFSAWSDC